MVYVNYISKKEIQIVGLLIQCSFQPLPWGSEDMKFIHRSLSLSRLAPPVASVSAPPPHPPGPHGGLHPFVSTPPPTGGEIAQCHVPRSASIQRTICTCLLWGAGGQGLRALI